MIVLVCVNLRYSVVTADHVVIVLVCVTTDHVVIVLVCVTADHVVIVLVCVNLSTVCYS